MGQIEVKYWQRSVQPQIEGTIGSYDMGFISRRKKYYCLKVNLLNAKTNNID